MIVIPMRLGGDDAAGAGDTYELAEALNGAKDRKRPPAAVVIVQSGVKGRAGLVTQMRKAFQADGFELLDAVVRDRIEFPEASLLGVGVAITNPGSIGHREIRKVARELAERGGFLHE